MVIGGPAGRGGKAQEAALEGKATHVILHEHGIVPEDLNVTALDADLYLMPLVILQRDFFPDVVDTWVAVGRDCDVVTSSSAVVAQRIGMAL